jgi:phosphate transport system ATP-binding protein
MYIARPQTVIMTPTITEPIGELMEKLKADCTIVIVTHNMQQAARVSGFAAFLMIKENQSGSLVEISPTEQILTNPQNKHTEDYVTGRFG